MIDLKFEVVKHGYEILENKNKFNSFMKQFYQKENKLRNIISILIEEELVLKIKTGINLFLIKEEALDLTGVSDELLVSIINTIAIAYNREDLLLENTERILAKWSNYINNRDDLLIENTTLQIVTPIKTNVEFINFENGERYEGEVLNGKPHGKGVMYYNNDFKYESAWYNGFIHGKGFLFYKNEMFEIEWSDIDTKIEFIYLKEYKNDKKRMANKGIGIIIKNIGDNYLENNNILKAFECYKIASELENSDAMFNIGFFYLNGDGIAQDYFKATEWFQKSAELGNNLAMLSLGICYLEGNGVIQNHLKATEWFQKSAELGNLDAINFLKNSHQNINNEIQTNPKTFECYLESAELGNP
ncbi:SEL1-like repeat protein, partial [bacterium]|nr:SEL1-like repeat protein [bacterium]